MHLYIEDPNISYLPSRQPNQTITFYPRITEKEQYL